jgi:transcriptional regulator with XRE-family HTH domain
MKTHKWEDVEAELDLGSPEARAGYEEARREFELGRRVRELREAAGLSQRDLARAVGTSQPAIVRLELGGGMPRLDTLERVADALGAELVVALMKRPARSRGGRAMVKLAAPATAAPLKASAKIAAPQTASRRASAR